MSCASSWSASLVRLSREELLVLVVSGRAGVAPHPATPASPPEPSGRRAGGSRPLSSALAPLRGRPLGCAASRSRARTGREWPARAPCAPPPSLPPVAHPAPPSPAGAAVLVSCPPARRSQPSARLSPREARSGAREWHPAETAPAPTHHLGDQTPKLLLHRSPKVFLRSRSCRHQSPGRTTHTTSSRRQYVVCLHGKIPTPVLAMMRDTEASDNGCPE